MHFKQTAVRSPFTCCTWLFLEFDWHNKISYHSCVADLCLRVPSCTDFKNVFLTFKALNGLVWRICWFPYVHSLHSVNAVFQLYQDPGWLKKNVTSAVQTLTCRPLSSPQSQGWTFELHGGRHTIITCFWYSVWYPCYVLVALRHIKFGCILIRLITDLISLVACHKMIYNVLS